MRKFFLVCAFVCAGGTAAYAGDGAVAGGLLGAGAGAIIGGAASNSVGGAVAGGIIGGAAGAIIGNAADQDRARRERRGFYYNHHGRCYYEYPNGRVVQVARHPC